jgi:hypothetical protein
MPIVRPRIPVQPGSQLPRISSTYPYANPYTPPIPNPTENLSNLASCVHAIKASVESLIGQRGDASNRAVTFNDLISFGLLTPGAVASEDGTATGGGGGTITGVFGGVGLSGGSTTGSVTLDLEVPVPVGYGGTGASNATTALANLGAAPLTSPVFLGDPRAPVPALADNDTSIPTTSWVKSQGYQSSISPSVTKTANYMVTAADMGATLVLGGVTFTLTLPAKSAILWQPGMRLEVVVTATVGWSVTNLTGLTMTGLVSTLQPGTSGQFVANADGTTLNFIPGMQAPNTGVLGGAKLLAATANNFVTGLNISGVLTTAQPSFANLSGSIAVGQITDASITYAKVQNVGAARLLGNPSGSAAAPSEITLGTGLSFAGTVLNATSGGSGTVTSITAGTGITLSPATITTTGSVALTVPVSIANGGTGSTTVAATPWVQKSGDTMTGNLTIAPPVVNSTASLTFSDGGSGRWAIYTSPDANHTLNFYTAAAARSALILDSASGNATFSGSVSVVGNVNAGYAASNGYVSLASGGTTNAGYIGIHRPDGTRICYFGFDPSAPQLTIEQGGVFAINGGSLTVSAYETINGGLLTINSPSGSNTSIVMNKYGSGLQNVIYGNTAGSQRWLMALGENTAEGAGDAGSNFVLTRYNNSGAFLSSALIIYRNVGSAYFNGGNIVLQTGTAYKPGGGAWLDSSDIRTKEDVAEYKTGLQEIAQLNPVSYKKNGKYGTIRDGRTFIGLVANDAREVMPEMVSLADHIVDDDGEMRNPDGVLALDATPLIYATVNALKELKSRVERLEARGG